MARKRVKYNLFDKGELVGEFTASELIEKLNVGKNTLHHCITHALVYQKRYTFERATEELGCYVQKDDPRFIKNFAEEWNAMCLLFRNEAVNNS